MKGVSESYQLFFELLRSGLWEGAAHIAHFTPVDWNWLYSLAKQQTVLGIVTAGIGHIEDVKVSKADTRKFIIDLGGVVARNVQMDDFIASLMGQFAREGITTVLVKGQGIAQCYERPLWRSCGDVDLLLDLENYEKAKEYLIPLAIKVDKEVKENLHLAMRINSFEVELHGTMRSLRNSKIDNTMDSILCKMFTLHDFRTWENKGVSVAIPPPNVNVLIIFTHILQHFFSGGIGIRQVCDWCRLMWTYKDELDYQWLGDRLKKMRLITEWKAFGCVAVNYLGLPVESFPFYDSSFNKRADRIVTHILKVGNFGKNRDYSYMKKYPYVIRKAISFWHRSSDSLQHLMIFPLDAIRYFSRMITIGTNSVLRGE